MARGVLGRAQPFQSPALRARRRLRPDANSGLVVAYLERSPGLAYLSVKIIDGTPRWMVTFEPRQDAINLEAAGVRELTREIAALGTLCDYLQTRTDDATRLTAL
ncbi:hypothetical protein N3K63_13980 [Microbacterium sp. W1N]|uniref:hypothetical protein n=1 Tax=Microbacterium festucae TaxID=2977531 RepID=UPI0021C0201C|nr:hypothetical protein [Microbacterium festucae]MCT9821389.1 hypothetical protein [Microbacterium festucae]